MKTGKTLAATALTLGMILSGIPFAVMADAPAAPTAAETTTAPAISQDQAVANAKKLLPMLQNLTLHSVYYSPAITFNSNGIYPSETFKPNPGNRWELVFRNDKTGDDANYRVSINADNGSLVRYDRTWSNQSHVQAISRTDAKIKADHYLQQLAPERVTSVSTVDSLNGKEDGTLTNINGFEGYRFRYVRTINGIPFPYNDILIDVDASGELLSCQSEWTDQLQVPANATATLTKEQATAAYRKALPVQQEYVQTDFLKENKSFYRLEYGVWSADYDAELPVIDAQTGVAIKSDGTALSQNATVSTKPLAEQPGASVTTKVITEQTALDLISSYNLGLDGFEQGKGVTREQYERSTGLQNSWQFMYFSKAGSSAWVSVGLDAKTGELLYMNRGDRGTTTAINATTASLTKEQAQQKVIDFLSKAAPSTLTQLAIDESWNPVVSSDPANYQFRFIPLLNGSPVRGNDFRITVDGKTGVVLQFGGESKFSTDLRVTSTEPVVSLETAKEKFIEHYPLSLQYVPIFDSADIMFRLRKVKGVALVYAPDFIYQSDAVDAVTGEWPDGKLSQLPPLEIKDIKGHWAEKQLRTYVEKGIFGLQDGNVHPNQILTRKQVLSGWINSSSGVNNGFQEQHYEDVPKSSLYFPLIEEAYNLNWIDQALKKFRPEDTMTRGELADLVARSLHGGEIAKATGATKRFTDVLPSNPNYDAIYVATSNGIMSAINGAFAPNQPVTKAQLAVVLARMIEHERASHHE